MPLALAIYASAYPPVLLREPLTSERVHEGVHVVVGVALKAQGVQHDQPQLVWHAHLGIAEQGAQLLQ